MELKTAEDILNQLKTYPTVTVEDSKREFEVGDISGIIVILANEIKNLKRTVVLHQQLIQHEENVRTTKARATKPHRVTEVFKPKDRVYRIKEIPGNQRIIGTVLKVNGTKALVDFADSKCWLSTRSIVHTQVK